MHSFQLQHQPLGSITACQNCIPNPILGMPKPHVPLKPVQDWKAWEQLLIQHTFQQFVLMVRVMTQPQVVGLVLLCNAA